MVTLVLIIHNLGSTISVSKFFYLKVRVINGECPFKWDSTVGGMFCVSHDEENNCIDLPCAWN